MSDKYNNSLNNAIDTLIESASSEIVDEMFDEINSSINDDDIHFSENHIEEINRILNKNTDKSVIKPRKISKHFLLVAIIAMIIAISGALSTGAGRAKFLNYFMSIQKQSTEFRLDEEMNDNEYYSNTNEINNYDIKLNYIPDGFIVSDEQTVPQMHTIRYTKGNQYFDIDKGKVPSVYDIDTENAETKYIDINGNKAFLSLKPEVNILFWTDNCTIYSLCGNINENELIEIAKNME